MGCEGTNVHFADLTSDGSFSHPAPQYYTINQGSAVYMQDPLRQEDIATFVHLQLALTRGSERRGQPDGEAQMKKYASIWPIYTTGVHIAGLRSESEFGER